MNENIEWIVFDLGNVLIGLDKHAIERELKSHGDCDTVKIEQYLTSIEDAWERGEISGEKIMSAVAGFYTAPPEIDNIRQALHAHLQIEFPENTALIKKLKKRYKVACLSNTVDIHWDYMIENSRFAPLMDLKMASHLLKARKPEKIIFDRALKEMQTSPEKCLLIDDLADNVKGARESGWNSIQLTDAPKCEKILIDAGIEI